MDLKADLVLIVLGLLYYLYTSLMVFFNSVKTSAMADVTQWID